MDNPLLPFLCASPESVGDQQDSGDEEDGGAGDDPEDDDPQQSGSVRRARSSYARGGRVRKRGGFPSPFPPPFSNGNNDPCSPPPAPHFLWRP